MNQVHLDGRRMGTRLALHEQLKDVLQLPEYYGKNLDALWDCLFCELEMPLTVYVSHFSDAQHALGEYAERLLQTFQDAARELDGFHLIVD